MTTPNLAIPTSKRNSCAPLSLRGAVDGRVTERNTASAWVHLPGCIISHGRRDDLPGDEAGNPGAGVKLGAGPAH